MWNEEQYYNFLLDNLCCMNSDTKIQLSFMNESTGLMFSKIFNYDDVSIKLNDNKTISFYKTDSEYYIIPFNNISYDLDMFTMLYDDDTMVSIGFFKDEDCETPLIDISELVA